MQNVEKLHTRAQRELSLDLHCQINTYFSLKAKCWLRGGVGGQFLRNVLSWLQGLGE